MNWVTDKEAVETVKPMAPLRPREEPKRYQDNVIDSTVVDYSSLLTYISGSSWTVNYYGQVLGADQVGSQQSVDTSGVNQQYRRLVGFELKVQDPWSPEQDEETKLFTATGTSHIYPSIRPVKGDMFVADIGDGRSAIFTLTKVRQLSIYEEAGFAVDYVLKNWSTEELMSDLDGKVVETQYFDKEGLQKGDKAFLTSEEVVSRDEVEKLLEKLTGVYRRKFWDKEFNTVLWNYNGRRVYDHFVVKFLRKLDLRWTQIPQGLNCSGIDKYSNPTIWDNMVSGDRYCYDTVEIMELEAPRSISQLPMLGGLGWSTIELTYSPTEVKLATPTTPDEDCLLDVHPVIAGEGYVLSPFWYSDDTKGMSKLERYLAMWFEGKSLETTELVNIAKNVNDWDDITQFYLTPIVLALLMSLGG